jgi:hypothetical protein
MFIYTYPSVVVPQFKSLAVVNGYEEFLGVACVIASFLNVATLDFQQAE